jgi:hypothetical protein
MRMRGLVGLALLLAIPLAGRADVPVSLEAGTGVIAGSGPWRAAPSLAFQGMVGLPGDRFAIIGRVDGWTFAGSGPTPANSELTAVLGASFTQPLSHGFFFTAEAGPSLTFFNRPGANMELGPGLMLLPAFGVATRRRTLSLQVGGEALVMADGVRFGAVVGAVYTFR